MKMQYAPTQSSLLSQTPPAAAGSSSELIPMANEQEETLKKKVDRGKCNRRSRPYYFRRCKHKDLISTTNIESLPDEMLFRILLELEPQEIYQSAMLVCRRWYKIIRTRNFVQEHLEHSRPGLLIEDMPIFGCPTFVTVSAGGRIHKFKYPHKFTSISWCTCNGLALEDYPSEDYKIHNFFIENHTTNKRIALPPFSGHHYYSCIGYAPASKEYKVIRLNLPGLKNSILTVGVDKSWRHIDTTHISSKAAADLLRCRSLITQGFVHWAGQSSTCVLSLNVESEIITETDIPEECQHDLGYHYYLSTWRSVSMLIGSSSGLWWDVWEMVMKPNGKSGEWKKVLKIDLEARKCSLHQHLECSLPMGLAPIGWLNYMEVLVLWVDGDQFVDKALVFYNVGTREIQFIQFGSVHGAYVHKNSLVWFDHT